MQLKNSAAWETVLRINQDNYGAAVCRYAERWADMMEQQMTKTGCPVAEIAKETSYEADTKGITRFMYGCAVEILAEVWKFGEELRCWHNLDTQIHDEGERANTDGGVLNPALLTIVG